MKSPGVVSCMFQCPHGLELLLIVEVKGTARIDVSMPSRAWVVTFMLFEPHKRVIPVSMPSRAWVVTVIGSHLVFADWVSMPSRAWVVTITDFKTSMVSDVSMPSRAWVVTSWAIYELYCSLCFNALTGLSCYSKNVQYFKFFMILFMHTCYL